MKEKSVRTRYRQGNTRFGRRASAVSRWSIRKKKAGYKGESESKRLVECETVGDDFTLIDMGDSVRREYCSSNGLLLMVLSASAKGHKGRKGDVPPKEDTAIKSTRCTEV